MSKESEALNNLVSGQFTWEHRMKCKKIIEKELKALNILKEKTTSACNCLMILKARTDNLDYHNYKKLFLTNLTQEEFNLLKEVFL